MISVACQLVLVRKQCAAGKGVRVGGCFEGML
jgi:hypothetical protein